MLGVDNVHLILGNAEDLDDFVLKDYSNAILFYWRSVIGYCGREVDRKVLEKYYKVTKRNGKLFVLRQSSKNYLALLYRLLGYRTLYNLLDLGKYLMIEKRRYDYASLDEEIVWKFYRKNGNGSTFEDRISMLIHVHSIDELINIARDSGWVFNNAYSDISPSIKEYDSTAVSYTLNIVFIKP